MESLGFKLFKDPDLIFPLVAGDLKIALNAISQREQMVTVYFGAWDSYDASTKSYKRTKVTLGENDTLLWTLVRLVDDGTGNTVEEQAVEFVGSVAVTAPDEDNIIELNPNNPVANFYYKDSSDYKVTTVDEHTLWCNFNIGEYKFGWSTSTNEAAGGFRLAKRDPNDPANEIIMTREMRYGNGIDHPDRYTTFSHGDDLPTDGWYVKDFWAYTYPNGDNDDVQENDIIPRLRTLQSGVANAIRIDILFRIPDGYTGTGQDFSFRLKVFGLKNVLVETVEL
jgi:hypothetical protein